MNIMDFGRFQQSVSDCHLLIPTPPFRLHPNYKVPSCKNHETSPSYAFLFPLSYNFPPPPTPSYIPSPLVLEWKIVNF